MSAGSTTRQRGGGRKEGEGGRGKGGGGRREGESLERRERGGEEQEKGEGEAGRGWERRESDQKGGGVIGELLHGDQQKLVCMYELVVFLCSMCVCVCVCVCVHVCVCVWACVCVCVCVCDIPSHTVPLPVKPGRHSHVNPSARSIHTAFSSQLSRPSAHSSTTGGAGRE